MNGASNDIINGYIDEFYEDENISSFYGVPRQPHFPIPDFQKIKEIKLSTILKIFYALGFEHINIVEKACRWIDDELINQSENKDIKPYKLLRQISYEEKERGKAVSEHISGGRRKRRKSIHKKIKQKTKNKKTKNKKTKKYKYKK